MTAPRFPSWYEAAILSASEAYNAYYSENYYYYYSDSFSSSDNNNNMNNANNNNNNNNNLFLLLRQCHCPTGTYFEPNGNGGGGGGVEAQADQCIPCASRCADNAVPILSNPKRAYATTTLSELPLACQWGAAYWQNTPTNDNNNNENDSGSMMGGAAVTCACPSGFQGDGFVLCTACNTNTNTLPQQQQQTSSSCVCPLGTYQQQQPLLPTTCVPCRVCPSIATAVKTCLFGSTSDTTDCYCPANHYYSRPLNECFPCSRCGGLTPHMRTPCPMGAKRDTVRCFV
jgi:hypothetical protein